MRYLFTADWHLGLNLEDEAAALHEMQEAATAYAVDVIVCAGDIFDKPNIASRGFAFGDVASVLTNALHEFAGARTPFRSVAGNHDRSGIAHIDAVSPFVPRHAHASFAPFRDEEFGLYLIPWMFDPNESFLGHCQRAAPGDVIVSHASIVGASLGKVICESTKWGCSTEELGSVPNKVVLGDFHRRQPYYVGALRQCNFGEEGNPQGFEIYDSENGSAEWVELSCVSKHETVRLDLGERGWQDVLDLPATDKLRIILKGGLPPERALTDWKAQGIKVVHEPVKVERQNRVDVSEKGMGEAIRNDEELFRLYCDDIAKGDGGPSATVVGNARNLLKAMIGAKD